MRVCVVHRATNSDPRHQSSALPGILGCNDGIDESSLVARVDRLCRLFVIWCLLRKRALTNLWMIASLDLAHISFPIASVMQPGVLIADITSWCDHGFIRAISLPPFPASSGATMGLMKVHWSRESIVSVGCLSSGVCCGNAHSPIYG